MSDPAIRRSRRPIVLRVVDRTHFDLLFNAAYRTRALIASYFVPGKEQKRLNCGRFASKTNHDSKRVRNDRRTLDIRNFPLPVWDKSIAALARVCVPVSNFQTKPLALATRHKGQPFKKVHVLLILQ